MGRLVFMSFSFLVNNVFSFSTSAKTPICQFGGNYDPSFKKCLRPMFYGNYYDAQTACEFFGGSLPCIRNMEQNEVVRKYPYLNCIARPIDFNQFIGNQNPNTTCDSDFLNASSITAATVLPWLSFTARGFPRSVPPNSGFYVNTKQLPVFEQNNSKTVFNSVCDNGWYYYNNACYFFQQLASAESGFTWEEADIYCSKTLKKTANLVKITSAEENEFVLSLALSISPQWIDSYIWLGMKPSEDTKTWADGTPLNYTNWVDVAPMESQCAAISTVDYPSILGKWFPIVCSSQVQSIVCREEV